MGRGGGHSQQLADSQTTAVSFPHTSFSPPEAGPFPQPGVVKNDLSPDGGGRREGGGLVGDLNRKPLPPESTPLSPPRRPPDRLPLTSRSRTRGTGRGRRPWSCGSGPSGRSSPPAGRPTCSWTGGRPRGGAPPGPGPGGVVPRPLAFLRIGNGQDQDPPRAAPQTTPIENLHFCLPTLTMIPLGLELCVVSPAFFSSGQCYGPGQGRGRVTVRIRRQY